MSERGGPVTLPASDSAGPWRTAWQLKRLSWAEWRAHPWRQAAAVMAIALGVALAFSVHLINHSALTEFAQALRSANGEPDLSLVARGPDGLDERLLDRAALHPLVRAASPRVVARGRVGTTPVRVLGVDALAVAPVAPDLMPMPGADADGASAMAVFDPTAAFVNPALARELAGARTLTLTVAGRPQSLRVAGSVAAGGGPTLVMDVAAAQAAAGLAGRLTQVDLRLQPGSSPEAIAGLLRDLALPDGVRAALPDEGSQRLSNLSRAYRVNLTVLALVALVVGAFLVFSVVSLAVAQRTPSLALLGVLGLPAAARQALVVGECAATGLIASALGLGLGAGLAAAALRLLAGDLGGGVFDDQAPALHVPWGAALGFALLGTLAATAGGWWPARQAARLAPALALKGLGSPEHRSPPWWPGVALLAAGGVLALLPPWGDLPIAAYASVGAALVGGIALLPWAVQGLLGRRSARPATRPLWLLALQRARFSRDTATAAVAGVVASLALCVAITVMVASFREAVTQWLEVVLPADLYARANAPGGGEPLLLPDGLATAAAALPGVRRVQAGRILPISLSPVQPDVWLLVRALGDDPARVLPVTGPVRPTPPGEVGVLVSEAMQALYGAQPGGMLTLPLAGRPTRLFVRGVWRDYARQFGSVAIDSADHLRLTGDAHRNELALWLAPGASPAAVQDGLRALVAGAGGDGAAMVFSTTAQLKALSLRIFDRSFAVTRYLQAVAIAIGLAGVAASLSAQVLARRREFGLLAHLGLTRAQVLRLVTLEALCWLLAGVGVGVLLGLAISAVLVLVVNPQSFHWSMDWQVPLPQVAALAAAVLLAGGLTSAFAARHASSAAAVRSVKEDW